MQKCSADSAELGLIQQRSTVGYRRNVEVEVAVVGRRQVLDVGKERKFEGCRRGRAASSQQPATSSSSTGVWSRVTRTAGWDWRGGKGGGEFGAMRETLKERGSEWAGARKSKRPCSRFLGLAPQESRFKICWCEFRSRLRGQPRSKENGIMLRRMRLKIRCGPGGFRNLLNSKQY